MPAWRVVALAVASLGAGGCDQIFGLKQTIPDGAPNSEPVLKDDQPVQVTFLAYDSYRSYNGLQDPVTTPAMPGLVVKVGTIDDTTLTPLEEATVDDHGNALPPGSYLIPGYIFGMVTSDDDTIQPPWRLELTNVPGGDGSPVELQWKPHQNMGHWAMPLLGRIDATTPSAAAGFTITPTGSVPSAQSGSHVMTSGEFTDGQIGFDNTSAVDWSFATGEPLSGPSNKAPKAGQDFGFLVSYGPAASSCRASTGNVAFEVPDLSTDTHAEVSHDAPWAAWDTLLKSGTFNADTVTAISRVDGILNGGSAAVHMYYGYTPTISLPFFIAHNTRTSHTLLDGSMFTLSDCPLTVVGPNAPLPAWSEPDIFHDLMKEVMRMTVSEDRNLTTTGFTIESGMEAVVTNGGTAHTFAMDFPAAMPTRERLTTSIGTTDLTVTGSGSDGVHVPMGTGLVELDITPETGTGPSGAYVADYYQVALAIANGDTGQVQTVRTFITAAPKVRIDASMFTPGTEYLFEVRAIRGTPNAKLGDFVSQQYPQAVASVYTYSFIAE